MNFYFLNPKKLNPIEEFSKERVDLLQKKIISEGYWSRPISVAKEHNLVMDGHHRLEVSLKLGFVKVPCFIFSYQEIIISNFLKSIIFPYKTAKHELPNLKFDPLSLELLK